MRRKWDGCSLGSLFDSGGSIVSLIARAEAISPGNYYFSSQTLNHMRAAMDALVYDVDGLKIGYVIGLTYSHETHALTLHMKLHHAIEDLDQHACQCEYSVTSWICLKCNQRYSLLNRTCGCLSDAGGLCELEGVVLKSVTIYPIQHDKIVSQQMRDKLLAEMSPSVLGNLGDIGGPIEQH